VSECLDPWEGGDRWWDWRRWEGCGQELGDLESKVPVEWMAAVRAGGSPSEPLDALASEAQTSKMLVARMGWETREGIRFTVGEYSVRLGTALQHDQVRQRRAEAHMLFMADAVGRAPNSPVVAEEVQRLIETLPRLWQEIKWENTHKEAYWRLTAVDGIPLLGNSLALLGQATAGPGHGASQDTPRQHHFWTCPVRAWPKPWWSRWNPGLGRPSPGTMCGWCRPRDIQSNACGMS
jgi:hypothetical protein